MDGVSISLDVSTLGILILILYKVVQLEYRIKRLEEVVNRVNGREMLS